MDKAYVNFEALYRIHQKDAFFVTRAKSSLKYEVKEQSFNTDQTTGLRSDQANPAE
jgi:sortase (surface protein transpeptidase)